MNHDVAHILEINELKKTFSDAITEYESAVARNAGISSAKDRVRNLLFSRRGAIVEALTALAASAEKVAMLEDALAESDEENSALRKELRELRETSAPAKKRKTKTLTAVVDPEETGGDA